MAIQIDYNGPRYAQAAAEILRRHDAGEPEANITSAVRDFLIVTGLVRADEIVEEDPPAQGSRRAVDLAALGPAYRRTGTDISAPGTPSPGVWESEECRLRRQPALPHARVCLHIQGRCPQPPPPLQAAR